MTPKFACIAILICACQAASADDLIAFDAAGRAIGYYAGNCVNDSTLFSIYSATGYHACFYTYSGGLINISPIPGASLGDAVASGFTSADCSGQPYAYASSQAVTFGPFFGGFVISSSPKPVYTVNDGNLSVPIILNSAAFDGDACQNFGSPFATFVLPVFENDPAITGFSNVSYTPPLRVQPAPSSVLSDEIFFDGFE